MLHQHGTIMVGQFKTNNVEMNINKSMRRRIQFNRESIKDNNWCK